VPPTAATEPPPRPRSIVVTHFLFAASLPCAGIAVCAPFAALGWFPDLCLHLSWVAALTLLPGIIAVRRQPLRCSILFLAMICGLWPWVSSAYAARAPIPTSDGIRVATGNLFDFNPRRDAALRSLLALEVDLLAVQEVLRTDEPVLTQNWPHVIWSEKRELFACALLSRFPFSQTRIHELEEYALIEAVVQTPNGPLRVFVVHLASPKRPERAAMRSRQLVRLAELVRASLEPVLITGDFNLSAAAPDWAKFSAEAQVLRPSGLGPATWPYWLGPFGIDLDHIAGRGVALAPLETVVIPGSDHRALRTRVTLR
jgi:vancomycin resistance protein VanJ